MKTKRSTISRRGLLTTGAVVAAGSAALAGTSSLFGQGPAVITSRRFRGWVTRGGGTNRTTLQELTLRPVSGRQLVVRTEATNLCYSNVGAVTGLQANAVRLRHRPPALAARDLDRSPLRPLPAVGARVLPVLVEAVGEPSFRGTEVSESWKPSGRKCAASESAIVSACRELRSAAPATSVFADAPTCASS